MWKINTDGLHAGVFDEKVNKILNCGRVSQTPKIPLVRNEAPKIGILKEASGLTGEKGNNVLLCYSEAVKAWFFHGSLPD